MTSGAARPAATPPVTVPVVNYWAVSVFSSKTFWVNVASFLVAALSLTEVVSIIPPQHAPKVAAGLAILNIWLRTATVRPVAFISPGTTVSVAVPKIGPPAPPMATD